MKHITRKMLDWVLVGLWFLLVLWFMWITYAAWTTMTNVNTWDGLTATLWNNLLWNVETLKTNTDWITSVAWKVWIWVPTATEKLDVAWTVKATKLESTKTSWVRVMVNWCSWPCAWSHTLNTWTNIAPVVSHSINNNDTSTYSTTWSNGTVTINKSWTYMIRVNMITMPVSEAWNNYVVPFINWAVNWLWTLAWDQAIHQYMKAGFWATSNHTFVADLTAWTTVWYWYYPTRALTYWAHDSHTGMEIIKLN